MKIKGHENFIRDTHSGAIINNDKLAFEQYKLGRKKSKDKDKKIADLESRLKALENLINEHIK
jgi:hypothetical protein